MPKKRDYLVVATTSNDPAHIAQITKEIMDAYANLKHARELDQDEREERARTEVDRKGPVDIEVRKEQDPVSNASRYYLVIAPKGKVQASLEEHKKRWRR